MIRFFIYIFLFAIFCTSCKQHPSFSIYKTQKEIKQKPFLALTWTAPNSWKEKKLTEFRKASFVSVTPSGECDVSVTSFPGDTGGYLANLNRWRSQLQLPALKENELEKYIQKKQFKYLSFDCVFFENKEKSMRIAMVMIKEDMWFFKIVGPKKAVQTENKVWSHFLDSINEKNI